MYSINQKKKTTSTGPKPTSGPKLRTGRFTAIVWSTIHVEVVACVFPSGCFPKDVSR